MKLKCLLSIVIMIGLSGCALFGVFSFSKDGGKEVFEVSRSMQRKINEEIVIDQKTEQAIETTWADINPLWKDDFNTYTNRYNTVIMGGVSKKVTPENLFIEVIKRTMLLKGFKQLHNLNFEDFGDVLGFPEGVDYTVYWFIINGGFAQLGFGQSDFVNTTIP